jgi:hypothetical protein
LVCATASALLIGTATAGAGNTTLKATIDHWSSRLGTDAAAVSLAARQRHPRLMTVAANRFRLDALRGRVATAAQHASTANGTRARGLALSAFRQYALAGARWAASGRARVANRRSQAVALAAAAARNARTGNALLVRAGKLLA